MAGLTLIHIVYKLCHLSHLQVEVKFSKKQARVGERVTLTLSAKPGSVCGYGVSDNSGQFLRLRSSVFGRYYGQEAIALRQHWRYHLISLPIDKSRILNLKSTRHNIGILVYGGQKYIVFRLL